MATPDSAPGILPAYGDLRLREAARPGGAAWRWWPEAAVVAGALAFAAYVFAQPIATYVSVLNIDDSFYYDQIARNFAHGLFSTFDGVNPTNGYHPLWAAMLTPVFALVADPMLALRLAKMLELALLLAAGLMIMAAGRRAGWSPILAAAAPIALFATPMLYSGMETAIQVLLFAGLMLALVRRFAEPQRASPIGWIVLACCLLPWARLESLSAAAAALAVLVVHAFWCDRRRLPLALAGGAALGASVAAYFLYNHLVFGLAAPVSGAIKNYWSALRFAEAGGYHAIDNLKHYYWAHHAHLWLTLGMAGAALGSWASPGYRAGRLAANHALDALVLILAAAYAARLAYGVAFVHYAYDNAYYYTPYLTLQALAGPFLVSRGVLLFRLLSPRLRLPAQTPNAAAALALLAIVALAQPWTVAAKWRTDATRPNWQASSYDGAMWIDRHLPRDAIVGSPDSGVVGYFAHRRVINLDGLVNSADFLRAMKAGKLEAWIQRAGVTHLANAVGVDSADGCAFIAAAGVQRSPYGGCRLLYEGVRFQQVWMGRGEPMQFRIYAYAPGRAAGPAADQKRILAQAAAP
jgi:hypothetical protein